MIREMKKRTIFLAFIIHALLLFGATFLNAVVNDENISYGVRNVFIVITQMVVYGTPYIILSAKDVLDRPSIGMVNIKECASPKKIILLVLISLATLVLIYTFRNVMLNLLYGVFGYAPVEIGGENYGGDIYIPYFIMSTISIVIVASVMEELFFRELLVHRCRDIPEIVVILFSTCCFAVSHHNFQQKILVIPLGIICAWVTLRLSSSLYAVIIHMVVNLYALFNPGLERWLFSWTYAVAYEEPLTALSNSFFGLALIVLMGCIIYISVYSMKAKEKEEKKAYSIKATCVYIGGCILYCVYLIRFSGLDIHIG